MFRGTRHSGVAGNDHALQTFQTEHRVCPGATRKEQKKPGSAAPECRQYSPATHPPKEYSGGSGLWVLFGLQGPGWTQDPAPTWLISPHHNVNPPPNIPPPEAPTSSKGVNTPPPGLRTCCRQVSQRADQVRVLNELFLFC